MRQSIVLFLLILVGCQTFSDTHVPEQKKLSQSIGFSAIGEQPEWNMVFDGTQVHWNTSDTYDVTHTINGSTHTLTGISFFAIFERKTCKNTQKNSLHEYSVKVIKNDDTVYTGCGDQSTYFVKKIDPCIEYIQQAIRTSADIVPLLPEDTLILDSTDMSEHARFFLQSHTSKNKQYSYVFDFSKQTLSEIDETSMTVKTRNIQGGDEAMAQYKKECF